MMALSYCTSFSYRDGQLRRVEEWSGVEWSEAECDVPGFAVEADLIAGRGFFNYDSYHGFHGVGVHS